MVSEENEKEVCSGSAFFGRSVLLCMPGANVGHCCSSGATPFLPWQLYRLLSCQNFTNAWVRERGCFKNVHVGHGMVKLVQPLDKSRARPARKEFIIVMGPREGNEHMLLRATGYDTSIGQGEEGTGAKGVFRPCPFIGISTEK